MAWLLGFCSTSALCWTIENQVRGDRSIEMRMSRLCLWSPERKAQGVPHPVPCKTVPLHSQPAENRMDPARASDGLGIGEAPKNGKGSERKLLLNSALLFLRPESMTMSRRDTRGDYI